jgi:hypothetical protein
MVRVRVSYVDGAGTPEQVVSDAVPVPTGRAGAPAIRKVVAGAPGGRTTATVKWATPAVTGGLPVAGYRVVALKVRKDGAVIGRDRTRVDADVHKVAMRLEPGRYRFKVRALNEHGAGPGAVTRVVRAR